MQTYGGIEMTVAKTPGKKKDPAGQGKAPASPGKKLFRFRVGLLSGPVTGEFLRQNPEAPSRLIDIRGSQTLEDLHDAIFKAFDRYDEHFYEFQFGGRKPADRNCTCYGIAGYEDMPDVRDAASTSIASLSLRKRQSFYYWFDFGDDWWHTITLEAVDPEPIGEGPYPRIVARTGASPPQYAGGDDDEDDEDEDEDEFDGFGDDDDEDEEEDEFDIIFEEDDDEFGDEDDEFDDDEFDDDDDAGNKRHGKGKK
jgi:hypothetical protein